MLQIPDRLKRGTSTAGRSHSSRRWFPAAVLLLAVLTFATILVSTEPTHPGSTAVATNVKPVSPRASASAVAIRQVAFRAIKSKLPRTTSQLKVASLVSEVLPTYQTGAALKKFENSPGMPACAAPTPPAATYPPNGPYGIPFVAAITNGELLTSYSEWVADHHIYNVGGTNYTLYPWDVKIYDITGWVTGLLELPSLNATIPPQNVVFCDTGGAACISSDYPQGECIHITQLFPGPGDQGSEITNLHPEGTACSGYSGGDPGYPYPCLGYEITLTPSGKTTLTVSGVESNGSLDLSVQTAAFANVVLSTQSCSQVRPTKLNLSTIAPTSLPPGAPIAPTAGNPDDRLLQVPLASLSGPLASASSTLGTDDFQIPAWGVPPTASCPDPGIQESLNEPAGGYDTHDNPLYVDQSAIAGQYGWSQFFATTTVATLGFQIGPPPNFSF
ncbi:MAG: hypothetical protein WAM97_07075 [Acidimicrobiales bacterium]